MFSFVINLVIFLFNFHYIRAPSRILTNRGSLMTSCLRRSLLHRHIHHRFNLDLDIFALGFTVKSRVFKRSGYGHHCGGVTIAHFVIRAKPPLKTGRPTNGGGTPDRVSCLVSHLVYPSAGGLHSSRWLEVDVCLDRVEDRWGVVAWKLFT